MSRRYLLRRCLQTSRGRCDPRPVLEAASAGDGLQAVATDDGIVVADSEGEVLKDGEDEVAEGSDNDCECHLLPGDYPCAHCYIDGDAEWPDEDDDRPE